MGLSPANSGSQTLSGTAGGDLTGTYPNPTIGAGKVTSAKMGSVLSREQLRANARGLGGERGDLAFFGGASAAVPTQVVYGCLVGMRAGDIITGIVLRIRTAAAGTAPTRARFGIADGAGTMLALSNDLGAAVNWVQGPAPFALAAPYTILADGGYYLCFMVNGAWGTTQPLLTNASGVGPNGASLGSFAGNSVMSFQWSAQADLPTVGAALTTTTPDSYAAYMAWYGTPII